MSFSSEPHRGSAQEKWDYFAGAAGENATFKLVGSGAERLGLQRVGLSRFLQLCDGAPGTGKKVQRQGGKHTPGIDAPLTAPKWLTARMVIASEEDRALIQQIWDDHVETVAYRIEQLAPLARKSVAAPSQCTRSNSMQGSKTERVPAELVAMIVPHHTARPTEETEKAGRPPDPHLHSHIWLYSLAWVADERKPEGGSWKAIDDDGIKRNVANRISMEAEGDLIRRLEEAGFRDHTVKQDRNGRWRSHCEPLRPLSEFWSSGNRRVKEVTETLTKRLMRPPTEAEIRREMVWTRLDKDVRVEAEPDWEGWQRSAREAGYELPKMARRPGLERAPLEVRKKELFKRLYDSDVGLCSQSNDACFGIRDIDTAVARCAVGLGLTFAEQDEAKAELMLELVVAKTSDHALRQKWTTRKNLSHEWAIHRELERVAALTYETPTPETIERAFAELAVEEGILLDPEQRAVVIAACESGQIFVEGFAGTGKSTSVKGLVRALCDKRSTGRACVDQVIAISTARDTGRRTAEKIGADRGDSVKSFCLAVRQGRVKPTQRTLLIIDEAVMVNNALMDELVEAMGDARRVFIGDRKQLQCIGAGGWYEDAVKLYGCKVISKVHRQKDQADIDALFDLRSGRAGECLANLDRRGRVHIADTKAERMGQAIAHVIALRDAGRAVTDVKIVLDGANTDIDVLNRILQEDRIRRGELNPKRSLKMFSTTTGREWIVYAGEEVSFISGYYDRGARLNIANGTKASVLKINARKRQVKIRLHESGATHWIDVPERKDLQPFSPNYAVHSMRLQGGEAPIILAMPGSGTTSLEAGYSQASRAIEELHVYGDKETHGPDPKEGIAQAWGQARPKISARTRMGWEHAKEHRQQSRSQPRPLLDRPDFERPWERKRRRFEVTKDSVVSLHSREAEEDEQRRKRRREREGLQRPFGLA